MPLLRWSPSRIGAGVRNDTTNGNTSEAAAVGYVLRHARQDDIDDVLATFDEFANDESMPIDLGEEKGQYLEAAVHTANPVLALELGTYCGCGALRIARAAPAAKVYSVERTRANAENAREIWAHAGVADRLTCVVGAIGDGGRTLDTLAGRYGFASGTLDFIFLDHDTDTYLEDLQSILDREWLHAGSIVVADNVKGPGAPKYRDYMRQQPCNRWTSIEHRAHRERQSLVSDVIMESEYMGAV